MREGAQEEEEVPRNAQRVGDETQERRVAQGPGITSCFGIRLHWTMVPVEGRLNKPLGPGLGLCLSFSAD